MERSIKKHVGFQLFSTRIVAMKIRKSAVVMVFSDSANGENS